MFTTCWVKNIKGSAVTGLGTGKDLTTGETYQITDSERLKWSKNSAVDDAISDDHIQIGDGTQYFSDHDDSINHLKMIGEPTDTDGSKLARVKITKTGWGLQCHAINFETSKLASVHEKKADGTNYAYCTMKFYDDEDTELTTQATIDTDCVRTDIFIEPTHDYEMIGGEFWPITLFSEDCFVHFFHVLTGHEFCSDFNARAVGAGHCKRMDGRAPKLMPHDDPVDHTNQLCLRLRHSAGFKHKTQIIMEFFK